MSFNIGDYVSAEQAQGFVRHFLTVVGTAQFTTHYNVSADDWQTIVSAAAVVIGVVWSFLSKKKSNGGNDATPTAPAPV